MAAEPNKAELALYAIVEPMGFKRQVTIIGFTKNDGAWSYILDAAWPEDNPRLAVEVDGSSHRTKKGRDRRRDTRVATQGIATLRFTNRQVLNRPDEVRLKVAAAIDRLEQGLPMESRRTKWDDVPNTEF
jgi:very-short-patch-repair endonuclease